MKKPSKLVVAVTGISLFVATPAYAVKLSAVGIGTLTSFKEDPPSANVSYSGKFAFGGGALLGMMFNPRLELEIGALYIGRKFDSKADPLTITTKFNSVEIPVLLRYWLSPAVSIGAGGYYDYGVGKVHLEASGGGVTASQDRSFSDLGLKKSNYGVVGSLAFRIPLGTSTALLLDGRYQVGLADLGDDAGSTIKLNDVQALAGLQFGGSK